MYSFINLLFSSDIFMIFSLFFSMFIIATMPGAAVVVFVLLFYLYFNKIRKKYRKAITVIT